MPIYEFKCLTCEEEFETLVFRANEEICCPHCSGAHLERLLSTCGVKSSGTFTPSSGSSGCASCAGGTCSTCH